MSYVKNTWTNGDTITAEKLNNMENGIASAGGTLIVGVTFTVEDELEAATMDKTWQEIHDALAAGFRVVAIDSDDSAVVQEAINQVYFEDGDGYYVNVGGVMDYYTNSASGYPSFREEPS